MNLSRRRFALLSTAAAAAVAAPAIVRTAAAQGWTGPRPKNVILMISDGAGFHTWNAASYYEFGELGRQVYDRFPVKTLMTTFPLNTSTKPNNDPTPKVAYDPTAAWSVLPGQGDLGGESPRRSIRTSLQDTSSSKRTTSTAPRPAPLWQPLSRPTTTRSTSTTTAGR
jgi:alkaline phosphatase